MRAVFRSALFHQAKIVKRKGTSQRKRRKVVATTKEPNNQATKRDLKQNVVTAMNSLG